MTEQSIFCKRVEIFGRVQGVWYRGSTGKMAQQLGLVGWVRNRNDGSVEAVFQGPSQKVAEMLGWCEKGPVAARVDRMVVTDLPLLDAEMAASFTVRY